MANKFDVKKLPTQKQVLIGSIICVIYFSVLAILSYYDREEVFIGVIVELATIPIILLTATLFIYSNYMLWVKRIQPRFSWIVALVLQTICILFLFA